MPSSQNGTCRNAAVPSSPSSSQIATLHLGVYMAGSHRSGIRPCMPLCFDARAMCNPPRHHQHISRMSDYSCAEMLHHVTPVKRPCILSFKSYAPVPQTLRKQTLGLRECDWTLSHIWCLIIRDIELSTTVCDRRKVVDSPSRNCTLSKNRPTDRQGTGRIGSRQQLAENV